jgi:hydroxyethylthiazole kinase-like uncharacterized protein yjeF
MTPTPILRLEGLRAIELRMSRVPGATLMERAGAAAAKAGRALVRDDGAPIVVVAGPGNNGGDAWVAAAHLGESFHRVVVFDVTGETPRAVEAQAARLALKSRGGEIVAEWPAGPRPALVVDGLFGIGLARPLEGRFAKIVEAINASGAPVLALDVPSGIDSETGRVRGVAVRATETITFIASKVGLHTGDGLDHCGRVTIDTLGLPASTFEEVKGTLIDPGSVKGWLAPRPRNSHKGHFGAVGVVGGNRGMVGAALLASRAALLMGAGKVHVGLLAADALVADPPYPELMLRTVDDAMGSDVLILGPGAGRSPSATTVSRFERIVLPSAIASGKALVLDADALNAIAVSDELEAALKERRRGPTILTPHPAEAARLLHVDTPEVQANRVDAACELAHRFGSHVVLKGAGSVCASPDGRWAINSTGNPGLASGGTGDVLAGMIGALLAQGLRADQALQLAVCLHGAAADACVAGGTGPVGLTAGEVLLDARRLLNQWIAGP